MKKVVRTTDFPIVQTNKGKLHGFLENDVYHFHGIRYGRARRFDLPAEVEPWDGVRNAKAFGYICPLLRDGRSPVTDTRHDPGLEFNPMADPFANFEMKHVYWPSDEDCLFLNVWTKHLPGMAANKTKEPDEEERAARKPVLFWLHGGGFGAGSAIEIPSYDGHNLAAYGDVVVVSLNHRLNCIGFLDLSDFGEAFCYSGIGGMADIVLALRWVHDNIAAFGGDPDNVTVAGQSGGGGKAIALLQMPSADGLYRRIISQSGAPGGLMRKVGPTVQDEKDRWRALGRKTAEVLGLTRETIETIRDIPYEKLADAAEEAGRLLGYPAGMMLFEPSPVPGFYEGRYEAAGFRKETKEIAVMAGTVLGEFNFMHYLGDKTAMGPEERRKLLEEQFGNDTDTVLAAFASVYPELDPLYALSVDAIFRPMTLRFLNGRASFTDAPCYNYLMSFIIPYLGGVTPWHCSCIPYMFRNVDMEPAQCTGSGLYAERLMDQVSDAWLSFMKTGDPSTPALKWEPYTERNKARMKFAETSGMTDADDCLLISLVQKHMAPQN